MQGPKRKQTNAMVVVVVLQLSRMMLGAGAFGHGLAGRGTGRQQHRLCSEKRLTLVRAQEKDVAQRIEEREFCGMFDFKEDAALKLWERIDDVVMGGVSSSAVRASQDGAYWAGIVRTAGGGFCGTRTVRLERPIDLSEFDGIYIEGALVSDEDVARRAWKCTVRVQRDAGELVYTAEWKPGVGSMKRSLVPFDSFQLARGPRLVKDAPPLTADVLKQVYGLGLTVSKFGQPVGADATLVDDFRDGFFRVDLKAMGGYGNFSPKRNNAPIPLPPAAVVDPSLPNSANSPNLLVKALRPLSGFVFSEQARRRKRARQLLKERNPKTNPRLYGQRVIKRGVKGMSPVAAFAQGIRQLSADALAGLLALPLRLLFRLVFTIVRLQRRRGPESQASSSSSSTPAPA